MKKFSLFLAFLFLFLMLPLSVRAAENSITVLHTVDGQPISDIRFTLFRLADPYEDAQEAYAAILQSGQKPTAEEDTDGQGRVVFSNLEEGQYLLLGESHALPGDKICEIEMSLLALPGLDGEGNWTHDLVVEPKYEVKNGTRTITYRVMKLWEDDGSGSRPDSIQVQLYRNGELQSTVTLSKTNRWQHSWTEDEPAAQWAVAELTPSRYRAEYTRDGNTFVVNNVEEGLVPTEPTDPTDPSDPTSPSEPTGPSDPTDPSEPTNPSDPTGPSEPTNPSDPTDPSAPTTPSESTEPTKPTEPDKPTLPQTGQLWWPVPLMAIAGLVLFLLGWLRRKERADEA